MVKINGEQLDVAGKSVLQYLQSADYNMERIVVERNMEIVPKTEYDTTVFEDGDEIEVVSFVGGG
ncbi:MAG: sulfur carrier protein ThiS [Eubacteriales bacterium]|nr:sulfur carrier protein ThiS [Eubacteriales bacterium]